VWGDVQVPAFLSRHTVILNFCMRLSPCEVGTGRGIQGLASWVWPPLAHSVNTTKNCILFSTLYIYMCVIFVFGEDF
jgi:hypothetical protein